MNTVSFFWFGSFYHKYDNWFLLRLALHMKNENSNVITNSSEDSLTKRKREPHSIRWKLDESESHESELNKKRKKKNKQQKVGLKMLAADVYCFSVVHYTSPSLFSHKKNSKVIRYLYCDCFRFCFCFSNSYSHQQSEWLKKL